ncbi:sugar kinase [Lentilactobacillus hilgardii]|uniref:Kinase, PfkB family n=1 Tax=Lentilactobacillus hilgardii (strain ATCC 8290 / DSM 20176 / CCUG 30140 / JCM 1155 / KCTC 3500 / NBRC 15886 / NCIMB 8040 / NRRL B-1843 / 9) TaxID=1423757 RepID=C0XN25_LENH9|nr:sugar kinase [Lentilactobacillus hilgardii]EEI20159.1 kinase, PfkB family [Lentilactobacillus buchneri ATCC 11577]EEI23227.1 kinase, PfkB family [Lentilactobacillus hilgardii DSM 20176 = ATCC 8290]KRK53538.1 2-dehydro-3-deoxygluconokinase [Lentilactobacillus hilgardii DSM 20176 = ATCC 8290]MCP9333882.1 sugar kinase [Lentilactobacillus hilgardii]MCP9350460.1 sugar kinase [Lentilactobacillus hilgardii]
MSELITIGEPIVTFASKQPDVSLIDATEFTKIMGGAELNVAIGATRLGHSTDYISRVGNEPFGDYVIKTILSHGVGTKYISRDPKYWTGHQLKELVTKGDPQTYNYRKGSAAAHLSKEIIEKVDLNGVKMAHMSGIFPAISEMAEETFRTLLERLIQKEITITFDPNLRPALWASREKMIRTINELAGSADIVLPGVEEGKILLGTDDPEKIADFYLKGRRTKAVIVKVGSAGAFVKTAEGEHYDVPGFKVKQVIDTVGAGDGFALGVITALLEGLNLRSAVVRGNAVGALQVQTYGDNDGYPDQKQLKAFYQKEGVTE